MKKYFRNASISFLSLWLFSALALAGPLGLPSERISKTAVTDQLLQKNREIRAPYVFDFHQSRFIGLPNVFSPVIFPSSKALQHISVERNSTFLEIGPGTGVFSIQAALDGASKVVAIDINPDAVENTRLNAALFFVENVVHAQVGDIFSPLTPNDRFDTIFWSIPFCHRPDPEGKMDSLDLSAFDPDYKFLKRFISGSREHLNKGGHVLLNYSKTHGDYDYLYSYAEENSFDLRVIKRDGDEGDFITVELFELTPKGVEKND